MANQVAKEEGLNENQCALFEADATIDPDLLLAGEYTTIYNRRWFRLLKRFCNTVI
jgi:hypothetical protein